jgi:hypothetical protein
MSVMTTAGTPATAGASKGERIRVLGLPLMFAFCLVAFVLLPQVRQNPPLRWSFLGAGATLIAWTAGLFASALRRHRALTLEVVLRKQHYLQACAQGSVLLYWGWYWRDVYDFAYLIAAQLIFAYAFDMLFQWSRRDDYTLGFGPFPITFSINLFLWFKPAWFYLQFIMVGLGFVAKDLIRWQKDGRSAHIFNPSSFPLAVFSLALLLTHTSDLTRGRDIATTQFYPPHIYLVLFLIGLPGQFFFGVTSMTMSAVVATYLFGLAYHAMTGVYFFYDSYIPIAVFLGMHLLFTDPSTSPRTELGRVIFGMLYGLSTVAMYELLWRAGLPTFYDKLLQVPVLNLSVKLIDRAARSKLLRAVDPGALGRWLAPRQRHLAYMSIWAIVFATMSVAQGVGDNHPGQWVPFWQRACNEDRPYACSHLADVHSGACNRGSGWACNEFGVLQVTSARSGENKSRFTLTEAVVSFERGCEVGFAPACQNLHAMTKGGVAQSASPTLEDYPIILRGTKGAIVDLTRSQLFARACSQGWPDTCWQVDLANVRGPAQ